jgi:hypothetical protein
VREREGERERERGRERVIKKGAISILDTIDVALF